MKEGNLIVDKSYAFSVKIVRTYQHLSKEKREFIISKQLLRSGTSIGANVEEGVGAQSPKDFINKLSISYKEARETKYWVRLLHDTDYIDKERRNDLINDIDELLRILTSIINTMKSKL